MKRKAVFGERVCVCVCVRKRRERERESEREREIRKPDTKRFGGEF